MSYKGYMKIERFHCEKKLIKSFQAPISPVQQLCKQLPANLFRQDPSKQLRFPNSASSWSKSERRVTQHEVYPNGRLLLQHLPHTWSNELFLSIPFLHLLHEAHLIERRLHAGYDRSIFSCWRQRCSADIVCHLFSVLYQIPQSWRDANPVDHQIDASSSHPNQLLPMSSLQVELKLVDRLNFLSQVDDGYRDYTLEVNAFASCSDTDACEEGDINLIEINHHKKRFTYSLRRCLSSSSSSGLPFFSPFPLLNWTFLEFSWKISDLSKNWCWKGVINLHLRDEQARLVQKVAILRHRFLRWRHAMFSQRTKRNWMVVKRCHCHNRRRLNRKHWRVM